MCGICGWVSNQDNIDRIVLDKMCDVLEHRGPDDRGVFVDGRVGIAMRRLCIIGVSSGHQPIHNENESNWIVFNGEIYNYLELKSELENKGHSFYTQSDTEVIIHLYEEFGEQAPEKLQGMFAFAIFDIEQQKIFISRDRLGIKPLYFFWDEDTFIFASEIQSILTNPAAKTGIDLQAISQFFTFGYLPHTKTSFKNIYKLLPGCTLTLQNNKISFNRYWGLTRNSSINKTKSLSSHIDDFFEIFQATIEKHLISEVPLGAFLSGGIDSSLVVGIMSRLSNQPVKTFSIGYDHTGSAFDERTYARKVSSLFNTTHTEFIIKPDIIEELPRIIQSYGEPIGNASVMLNYYLSREVAKHVTVALSGLGGDELCAGYERYMGATIADYYLKIPSLIRKGIPLIIDLVPDSKTGSHLPERLKRFVRSASLPLKDRYYGFINKFNNIERKKLFTSDVLEQLDENIEYDVYSQYWESTAQLDNLHKLMRLDIETYMVDDLLALTDKTSMAHSLEIRVPFLDHKLTEFLWNIPTNLKLHGLPNLSIKYFLKKASERILPKEVIYRRKKGFSIPLSIWLRTSLKTYIEDILGESSLTRIGLFNSQYVRQLLNEHYARKANHDEKIFSLLSFVLWHRSNFEGNVSWK